ncbi:MAG: hypothetical protein ACRECF_12685 [Methyloceanibacter sp.]
MPPARLHRAARRRARSSAERAGSGRQRHAGGIEAAVAVDQVAGE